MHEWMVISIVLVRAVTRDLRSRRDWVRYLLSPILPLFIKRCYDKKLQEGIWLFLYDFLKSSNKILSSVILKNVRCLRLWGMESFKYHITGKVLVLTRIGLAKLISLLLFLFIRVGALWVDWVLLVMNIF